MSTDLVPAENMGALSTLNPVAREIAVTLMLDNARGWLAHSVEATTPLGVSEFRAFVATIAESTKQLNLSKEIQLDATEMTRRAERALGLAIRKGQDEGTVAKGRANNNPSGLSKTQTTNGSLGQIPTIEDLAPDFYYSGMAIGNLADSFTEPEFEQAITVAKEEGNLTRANILRKGVTAKSAEARAKANTPTPYTNGKQMEGLTNTLWGIRQSLQSITAIETGMNPDQVAAWTKELADTSRELNRIKKLLKGIS